jgi:HAE1 family hydrophobic/amphiphilic exporter-1
MERFRFVITRPVAVTMVFLATLVFGWFSLQLLPVNLMPEISYPQLTVRAEYAGAAPAEVENDVARPLEEALGVVTGVTRISSISTAGYCDVVLEFAWGTDMDEANQDVLEKLDIVDPLLPDDVKQPLILRYDPNLDPVLVLSLSGEGAAFEGIAGLKQLRRIADRDIKRLIEPLDGVAAVKVKGGLEEEVLVELDEDALRRTNVALSAISQRLAAENINLAGGTMREGTTRYLVRTVNEFRDLDDIANTVVLSREGREVRLRDVAKVSSGYKDREVVTRVDGAEAVQVEIYKEADANIVDMATRVRQRLDGAGGRGSPPGLVERMQREYGVRLDVVSDRSLFINSSIQEVLSTALFGGLLAVLVLFLFLRDLKPTLIVGLSIPVSVIVTFAPLKLAGVSLNVMSLGGLALGIGMLVDNSIVVLESIQRCVDEGDTPLRAVVRGTSEVGSAVISSTLTTVAVFFPMVFVEGVAGQMFGDLGLTIVFSLLASLAVAMSLIPMLSARSFKPEVVEGRFITALVQHWTAWGSVSELVASAKAARWWTWLLVLPALWRLVRFALHLAFELVGKLVWTLFVIVARVVLAVGLVGFRIIGVAVSPVLAGFSAGIDVLGAAYRYVIRASLRGAVVVYLLVVGAGASLVILAPQLDTELIPEMHQGEFTVEMKFPVGTPLGANEAVLAPLERELREEIPRLRATVVTLGTEKDDTEAGEKGEHVAKLAVALYAGGGQVEAARRRSASGAPASGAPASGAPAARDGSTAGDGIQATGSETDAVPSLPAVTTELAEEEAFAVVRRVLDGVPDLDYTISRPALFSFKTPVEVEVRGYELEDLAKATALVAEAIEHVPGLRDIESSIQPGSPEIQIIYDRDALTKLGLDIRVVAELVRDKVQGYEATKFNRRDRKIPVRVRLAEIREAGVEELRQLVVNPGGARPIPLEAVADVRLGRGPNEIRRISQQRVGLVTASVEGIGLGSASERIREAVDALELPEGTSAVITGQSEEWETSSRSLWIALALSVFLVYVIMASQFENLVQPRRCGGRAVGDRHAGERGRPARGHHAGGHRREQRDRPRGLRQSAPVPRDRARRGDRDRRGGPPPPDPDDDAHHRAGADADGPWPGRWGRDPAADGHHRDRWAVDEHAAHARGDPHRVLRRGAPDRAEHGGEPRPPAHRGDHGRGPARAGQRVRRARGERGPPR